MKPGSFTLKFITDAASTFHGTCGYDEWVHEGWMDELGVGERNQAHVHVEDG